jgi:hypothetical protein
MANDIPFFQFGDRDETAILLTQIEAWGKRIQRVDSVTGHPYDSFQLYVHSLSGRDFILRYYNEASIDLDVKALSAQS